ncbi:hypothetical protein [Paraglaciecola arctica]|uniref:Uncharacterized protein n=1 Tax=Paraglaciecola arctica BSs20135 TaxID=493475 RepID=K6YHQ2_9ALTE|nr:hypothetical protein [Paraglaciecola arctica]GAC17702.1 hypothetical protein GARC_0721 [Paraglaciecola arctica BSs20135]
MSLYTDTPLASAIFELFEKFNEKLVIHFSENQSYGAVTAFIFGGTSYIDTRQLHRHPS